MTITIRRLEPNDKYQWLVLWRGYLDYYEVKIADDITEMAWKRLMDASHTINGYCAVNEQGSLVGLVHYLFHPVTWSKASRCYLEDLFTSKEARGRGVGRALIKAVYAAADECGADQVYWLTQNFNKTAQQLYDKVATKTPFVKYARQDKMI